ncbi:MAG: efflux RND transporter periplasmic adaptor subunit [Rhodothermaceae bacterium]|nr:efflux RND transporter periplasmic adaptor subunit [Rhodothermaceae bacterium]
MKTNFLLGLGLILIATGFMGCNRDVGAESNSAEPIPNVFVAPIEKRDQPLPIRTSGRLSSKAEVRLSFKIGGIIERLYVDEGRSVRKGGILARLNLAEIDAQVVQATSGLEKAQRDFNRVEGLFKDSVATLEQFQDAQTGVDIAEANVRIAEFNRKHAEIKAPSSGRILRRMAEQDELVSPGQPVFVFGSSQTGWVARVGLADRDIVKLALGDSAKLVFDAYPEQVFNGWVTEVADAADPMSSTFEVEVAIEDPGSLLKSGFIARVDLFPSSGDSYLYIPVEALVEGNDREGIVYVYDEDNHEAKKVAIQIGRLLDSEIAVAGGLEDYEHVVTDGASFLQGDGPVHVMEQ